MESNNRLEKQSSLAFINLLQGIINRMAANSSACKTWSITLVAAVIALTNIGNENKLYVCLGILGVFLLLDCLYLGLERRFIEIQNNFVSDPESKAFKIPHADICEQLGRMICALASISTTPVYGIVALLVYTLLK